ncbi:Fur family transcriptional regulator [Mucilaginibacter lacusdianchii]|uniref:Fur family transcriptional regulator n=1 Tax=Mucilaginibacter lacusdianchii TaxID=2684211 RepID=UPI00131E1188|nr:transcriptional repressor [Mucilaginibacter sp. JXJ CY 39]
MNEEFVKLLHNNQLKATASRLSVLQIISERDAAISQPVLEKMLGEDVDRVTLYRILKTFEDKGILHKVIDLNGTANYAICHSSCSEHAHHDEHFHFNCSNCHSVYCMNDFHLPALAMPPGFKAHTVNLSITGLCKKCS